MFRKDSLGVHKPLDFKGSAGVGYVIIPAGENRSEYIENCYRTQTVYIQGGYGYGYFGLVHVAESVMQEIVFPQDAEGADPRGSAVIWVKDATTDAPVIVGTLRREVDYYALKEGQRRWACGLPDGNAVEVLADAEGRLNITVIGGNNAKAEVVLRVSGPNADSRVVVDCDNAVSVQAAKAVEVTTRGQLQARVLDEDAVSRTTIAYVPGKGLRYHDEFDNEITAEDGKIHIVSKEISHNSGEEPAVLGDSLAKVLDSLIDAVCKLTVVTPVGTSSVPVNVADFIALKQKWAEFKSKKTKLE